MAQGVNYDVNAWLRTKGTFDTEANRAAKSADKFGSSWSRMSNKLVAGGEAIRGQFGAYAGTLAKAGAMAGAAGLAGGLGFAIKQGVHFNEIMETGALGLATMYQSFGVADELDENIKLAKAMQQELIKIAEASPADKLEMFDLYNSLAPGVSGVTQDLQRQAQLMEKMSVMGWATGNDYTQLGMDVGRIVQGLAGADVRTFKTLEPVIKKAFTEVTGKKVSGDFSQQFNKVAKQSGDDALKILEKAMAAVGPEVNKAFGESFGGVLATTKSNLLGLSGAFGEPIFEAGKKALNRLNKEAVFGDEKTFKGLKAAAYFGGEQIGKGVEWGAVRLERAMVYISKNWADIATMIRNAGVAAGLAIKTAIVVGSSRFLIGSAVSGAGKAIGAAGAAKDAFKPVAEMLGKQIKTTHMGLARGMKGGGKGITGAMGRGMSKVFGKMDGSKSPLNIFRGFDKGILKVTALVTTVGSLGVVAGIAGAAIGGVAVAVGGVAAYFVSNWDRISKSIVKGLEDGTITLVPLMTSLYTFYMRLEMVGQALLGGNDAASTMQGGLNMMSTAVDLASGTISWFIKGLSIMVGAWGTLKLGMLGVMYLIERIVALGVKLRVIDQSVLNTAQGNLSKFADGVQDTFTRADQLASAAEKIGQAQLSPMDVKRAEDKAKKLQQSLADALSGKAEKTKGRASGSKVKINKVEVKIDMRDPDPDRLMAAFVAPLERMADKRVQPWETVEAGD